MKNMWMVAAMVAAVVIAATMTELADATSSGEDIAICDPRSPMYGCDPDRFRNGDRLDCRDAASRLMHWATRAVRSDKYRLFAGPTDVETDAVASYVPGELLRVHLLTTDRASKYRGLMLQARDEQDEVVGDWELANAQPSAFQHAPLPCDKTVLHQNADIKSMVSTFHFRAPPEGTGPITFHALVKFGDANMGEFYWPNEEGPLTLAEGDPSPPLADPTLRFLRSAVGQSCTEACALEQLQCDPKELGQLSSVEALESLVATKFPCRLPLVSQCGSVGATSSHDDICYYHSEAMCQARGAVPEQVACDARSDRIEDGRRFCACSADPDLSAPTDGSIGVLPPGEVPTMSNAPNAATPAVGRVSPVLLPLLATMAALRSSTSQSSTSSFTVRSWPLTVAAVLMVCLSLLAAPVSAHNWIESKSRSDRASTRAPAKVRSDPMPHIQVIAGQEFEIEWVTAHGDIGYFAIVKAEDEPKLAMLDRTDLRKYINDCPDSADYMEEGGGKRYRKFHRKEFATLDLETKGTRNLFESIIQEGDPDYSKRDESFIQQSARRDRAPTNVEVSVRYKENQVNQDKRCAYTHPDYPFIIEVSAFQLIAREPRRSVDSTRFRIGRSAGQPYHVDTPPGDYIVWWVWRGYYDMIDVQVVDKEEPTEFPYGRVVGGESYNKVDHCELKPVSVLENRCVEVIDDLSECFRVCNDNPTCTGIQVAPLAMPDSVHPTARDELLVPLSSNDNPQEPWCRQNPFRVYTGAERQSVFACFAVVAQEPSETQEAYITTPDAQDPTFYGTCYLRQQEARAFDEPPGPSAPTPVDWYSSNRCLSCVDKARYETFSSAIPLWAPQPDSCVNCDLEPLQINPESARDLPVVEWGVDRVPRNMDTELPWTPRRDADNTVCNHGPQRLHTCANQVNNPDFCWRRLGPRGAAFGQLSFMQAETCYEIARRQPDCNQDHVYYNTETGRCHCFRDIECCGECVTETSVNFRRFVMPAVTDTPKPTTSVLLPGAGAGDGGDGSSPGAGDGTTDGNGSGTGDGSTDDQTAATVSEPIPIIAVVGGCAGVAAIAAFAAIFMHKRRRSDLFPAQGAPAKTSSGKLYFAKDNMPVAAASAASAAAASPTIAPPMHQQHHYQQRPTWRQRLTGTWNALPWLGQPNHVDPQHQQHQQQHRPQHQHQQHQHLHGQQFGQYQPHHHQQFQQQHPDHFQQQYEQQYGQHQQQPWSSSPSSPQHEQQFQQHNEPPSQWAASWASPPPSPQHQQQQHWASPPTSPQHQQHQQGRFW